MASFTASPTSDLNSVWLRFVLIFDFQLRLYGLLNLIEVLGDVPVVVEPDVCVNKPPDILVWGAFSIGAFSEKCLICLRRHPGIQMLALHH